jgi:hypothetical protein
MSETVLFALGGVILLIAIGALAVYGITYSKTRRYEQIGSGFDGVEHVESKPGTPV